MKKLLWLLLVPSVLTAQADTVKLSPKELFEASSAWNGIGVVQSYVDFQKDVLSSSNLSVSIVGKQVSTTLNLGYNKSSLSGAWSQSFLTSLNPAWDYYGAGYGITRNTNHITSTLQAFISTDFDFQKNITISVIELFPTKTFGTFGATVNVSKTFWGEHEGAWEGEYIVDEQGNWVKNIYPINPASSQVITRAMLMYTYTFKTDKVNISPQIFALSDIHKVYKNGITNIAYFSDFNLDVYYGTSVDWKITKRFVLNTNIRLNTTLDKFGESVGYKKSNPVIFMVGTQFQF